MATDSENALCDVDFALTDSEEALTHLIHCLEAVWNDDDPIEWKELRESLILAKVAQDQVRAIHPLLDETIKGAQDHLDYLADLADAHGY